MNLFVHNNNQELASQTPERASYIADRRAIVFAATDNAKTALESQFPGMSFAGPAPMPVAEVPVATVEQPVFEEQRVQDEFTQAA